MAHLGGTSIPLAPDELQLSRGESLPDTARALSRYLDVLAVRTHAHAELEAWAEWATIPVINALTADEHPCQALADALTIRDRLGIARRRARRVGRRRLERARLARRARAACSATRSSPRAPRATSPAALAVPSVVRDPREAVRGADVVVTDTWISMGQEHERASAAAPTSSRTARRGAARAGVARRVRPALPAGAPRRGDRGGRALRPALGDLGRGREPPARPEGAARAATGGLARRVRTRRTPACARRSRVSSPDCQPASRDSSRTRNQSSIVTRGFARASAIDCVRYCACFAGETPTTVVGRVRLVAVLVEPERLAAVELRHLARSGRRGCRT